MKHNLITDVVITLTAIKNLSKFRENMLNGLDLVKLAQIVATIQQSSKLTVHDKTLLDMIDYVVSVMTEKKLQQAMEIIPLYHNRGMN